MTNILGLRKFIAVGAVTATCMVLCSCTIKQAVDPVAAQSGDQTVCVTNNPQVRMGFEDALVKAIRNRGYTVKVVQRGSEAYQRCTMLTDYTASWQWDVGLYLTYANIKVYKNEDGEQVEMGSAVYDSTGGGFNLSKFINAENKVNELVRILFPEANKNSV